LAAAVPVPPLLRSCFAVPSRSIAPGTAGRRQAGFPGGQPLRGRGGRGHGRLWRARGARRPCNWRRSVGSLLGGDIERRRPDGPSGYFQGQLRFKPLGSNGRPGGGARRRPVRTDPEGARPNGVELPHAGDDLGGGDLCVGRGGPVAAARVCPRPCVLGRTPSSLHSGHTKTPKQRFPHDPAVKT